MKWIVRVGLFGIGLVIALLALSGCSVTPPPFEVVVTPDSGHPPFAVTVTAQDMSGGTYTYEVTGMAAVQSTENVFKTVVHEWPWQCVVTWQDGDNVEHATVHVGLNNVGPTINRPLLDGKKDLWYGVPLERILVDCNYHEEDPLYPGYLPVVTGIKDPDGDSWTLTALTIKCDLQDAPDMLFYPPYRPGEVHADGIENAAIWYPTYTGVTELISGLPYPPYPEQGYPWNPCLNNGVPTMPPQDATITITAEDQFGASTTKTFRIPIGATGCSK